jgi:SAM-dependent methyltransferase
MGGPRTGDAFGVMLQEALAVERARSAAGNVAVRAAGVAEIIERDDGLIRSGPAARYFTASPEWEPFERQALGLARGKVLDVGCGAGRFALALQERDIDVTALDISAGAAAVARERGVRDVVCASVATHAVDRAPYDTFLLMGENLGLLESRERAPDFLAGLARLARPGARIIGHGADPGRSGDPVHDEYARRNRDLGRMPGQMTIRIRHRDLATSWFEYLLCSPADLRALAAPTPWELAGVDRAGPVNYLAVLIFQP